jgi:RNAse (barnase) inhibitor barstar
MKAPDLAIVDDAGVHPWTGAADPLKAAAAHAHLKFATANLAHAKDRATLFAELDRALKLPEHFGHNFDALADVLEDSDWLGKGGRVLVLSHAAAYRKEHPTDWATLEDLLAEAAEFWKERHLGFWTFVA